ncbi:Aste57867_1114 [Aphanomyces stellatus]|uniref:glucan endo-1,3-beta-D-glucosidase n=1 Tax=Aphanomyces stellatus TaxID=120398 RepID=A0A485K4L1_9STRA|nr:hypothetical protein As57867_001113 [Aphanomyces stellatus]VFT78335.1 Aste57867_1114 [Aphanomyces stellatus]
MGAVDPIPAAKEAGLQIAAGVWRRSGEAKVQADIDAIVSGIKAYPGTVMAVYVGNEDLANGFDVITVASYVTRVRRALSANGITDVPIGSVQRDLDFLHAPALADVCDVVGVFIYPYFGSSINAKVGGKARLTETGWPTSGDFNGHVGSTELAKAYWHAYCTWSEARAGTTTPFYFQYRDVADKTRDYNAHFGLVEGSTSAWKFDAHATMSSTTPVVVHDSSMFDCS